jgi:hypothetical protein
VQAQRRLVYLHATPQQTWYLPVSSTTSWFFGNWLAKSVLHLLEGLLVAKHRSHDKQELWLPPVTTVTRTAKHQRRGGESPFPRPRRRRLLPRKPHANLPKGAHLA